MCQVSINAWSLLMGGLVLQSVELIPVHEIRFPVRSVAWSFNLQNRLYIRRILKV
jgi:hypothetical protein